MNTSRHALLALSLCTLCATATAHTTVQVQAAEGTTTYNNLVIGHGCATASGSLPVIAQSVVFPTVNPRFSVTGTMAGNPAVVSITTLANVPQLIQNRDVFTRQAEKKNAAGQVIGFEGTEGFLSPDLHGLVPFRTAGITFPADSCATRLIVQIAIADICQKNGARNLWIPSVTPKYSDPTVDGIGAPANLTFNRDLAKNPLASSCGAGYTLTVTPSPEDVDANLRLPGWLD
ncbi:MAG: hypothetical protein U1F56_20240 [Rubrivivax sp.]